ncbi:hypothetical protein [Persicobacter psychrovividus]|uniref:Outer membrane protein beta-barrel domain-containing protein n=1 Tax=Persicobacter psychrovividus TaxID=387638 RepID=A0ABN6L709_9BACT|nr:hypothetical protein PEPS_12850 [Persicobacter psychrovividus]
MPDKFLKILLISCLLFSVQTAKAQFGLSATYFFSKQGDFSNPITPFSFRGWGQQWGLVGIETGVTLFRMGGMNIKNSALESSNSLVNPFFSLMVPVELTFSIPTPLGVFQLRGGGFGYGNLDLSTHEGNFDRAFKSTYDWKLANAAIENDNGLGYGYRAGLGYMVDINSQLSLTMEASYLSGQSQYAWRGTVVGMDQSDQLQELAFSEPDAQLDFTGYEISVGVIINTGKKGRSKGGKKRRRR